MRIDSNRPIKKIILIFLTAISTVIVVILTYILFFYSKNSTSIEGDLLYNVNTNSSILQYSDQYLSFNYPINFTYSVEAEKIPVDNERNINIVHFDDQEDTDPLRVSIDIYNNSEDLKIENYIKYQEQKGVMMLPDEIDSYAISIKRIGENDVINYLGNTIGEKNAFIKKQGKIVSIQQFGNSELIGEAYGLILKSIHIK